jgi:hypothetical protein
VWSGQILVALSAVLVKAIKISKAQLRHIAILEQKRLERGISKHVMVDEDYKAQLLASMVDMMAKYDEHPKVSLEKGWRVTGAKISALVCSCVRLGQIIGLTVSPSTLTLVYGYFLSGISLVIYKISSTGSALLSDVSALGAGGTPGFMPVNTTYIYPCVKG